MSVTTIDLEDNSLAVVDARVHRSPAFITHPAEPTGGYVGDVGDAPDGQDGSGPARVTSSVGCHQR